MFWRRKKFIVVIEPKKRETKAKGGRRATIRRIIIAVVALFVVVSSVEYEQHKLKRRQAAIDIMRLRMMTEEYIWEHGKCPDSIESLERDAGAKALRQEDITDPWGKRYDFLCPGRKNPAAADISSAGPDRDYATVDDVKID